MFPRGILNDVTRRDLQGKREEHPPDEEGREDSNEVLSAGRTEEEYRVIQTELREQIEFFEPGNNFIDGVFCILGLFAARNHELPRPKE